MLTIKTLQRRSGVFIVNFEHISHLVRVAIVDFKQVNAGRENLFEKVEHWPKLTIF